MPIISPQPPISAPDIHHGREFSFTPEDFDRVKDLIYRHAGIVLNPSKFDMVYGRLVRRLRAHNLASFDAYLQLLARDGGEFESFINALTTNLTSFFREAHHFPILAEYLKQHRASAAAPTTIWCAAASTGEEPYSIAMTAAETYDSLMPPVRIIASDLDTTVLKTAATGLYAADKVERLNTTQKQRFFLPGCEGQFQIRQELRNLITFRRVNLIDNDWPLRGGLDVIFCRNVMIYFDRETQLKILKKFAPLLKPDGLLFVGHSENFYHAVDVFTLKGKTVYLPAAR